MGIPRARVVNPQLTLNSAGTTTRYPPQRGWIPGVIPLKVRAITTENEGDIFVIAPIFCNRGNNFLSRKLSPSKSTKMPFFAKYCPQTQNIPFIFFSIPKKKSDTFPLFLIVQFNFCVFKLADRGLPLCPAEYHVNL